MSRTVERTLEGPRAGIKLYIYIYIYIGHIVLLCIYILIILFKWTQLVYLKQSIGLMNLYQVFFEGSILKFVKCCDILFSDLDL